MTENTILKIENLNVSFKLNKKIFYILRDININIHKKEKIAIVGESGCGKTTLANTILLLNDEVITDYSGNLEFFSTKGCCKKNKYELIKQHKFLSKDEIKHIRGNHISIIFQDPFNALNPVVAVGKQIDEVILNHHKEYNKKEVYNSTIKLLEMVNLKEPELVYKKYPHQLSGGQIQRICIAIAIANKPEIIIADEPTTALDADLKDSILKMLKDLVDKETSALVLITHDISIIKNYVDYIFILYLGEIIEAGKTIQVFENPLHPYTQFLLSCYVDATKKGKKLPTLPYDPINLYDKNFIFKKCIFLNRCSKKIKKCETLKPEVFKIESQKVKCWLYE